MSDFPKLTPAFTVKIHLGNPSPIGVLAQGVSQLHAPFIPDSGALVSEPSYPLKIDAVFLHGSDYLRFDPDGGHARLEVSSALRDKASGAVIRFDYSGTVDTSGASGKVLKGLEGAATTDYGEIFTHAKFETGHEALKELQNKVYVGSGRFILEDGKPIVVEYKISEVVL
ncbi:uncharacterized protein CTRU02_205700 [Colletotrichum truncatum]|uniref:Uncharacterized protein n=1 Tax=Colletotrichum truncatum TaxID=5467 RepID=A0ACC3Z544_COLTU|nr:uncharacterized protein CTRU02_09451 [Colletotrichum truncatum]KAF6788643.1 hypothetical protein CTRU02_09451 [Colletotrichum truncatum]